MMKKAVFILVAAMLGIGSWAYGALVVIYSTATLNGMPDAVQGVLITPDGEKLVTAPLGPLQEGRIIVDNASGGVYNFYFESLVALPPRSCYFVGGFSAVLTNNLSQIVDFVPRESRIQGFLKNPQVVNGTRTEPAGYFVVED